MKRLVTLFGLLALCLQASAIGYGVVDLSVCNVRRSPSYSSELVTQALLGTPVHVLGAESGWPHIQSPDGYTGYVNRDAITKMTKAQYHEWNAAPKAMVIALFAVVKSHPDDGGDTVSDVVGGDRLWLLGEKKGYLHVRFPSGREGYISKADAIPDTEFKENVRQDPEAILETALSMVGFPYLWGGTSPKGFDCSGYVRTVLALHGIIMPRDADQQAPVTERIETSHGLDKLQPGDLLFFGSNGRVRHVGFYMGDGRFLHCIGKAHINSLIPGEPDYDAGNAPTLLYGGRYLHWLNSPKHKEINTYWTNPYYLE